MTWSMSRVIRSSVERPSTGMAAASAAVRSMRSRTTARPWAVVSSSSPAQRSSP